MLWNVPEQFPGLHVPGAYDAFGVVCVSRLAAFLEGRADDHDILDHRRRGVQADFTRRQIDLLSRASIGAHLHVDHAVLAEGVDRPAGLGIQFDQPVAGGYIQDALIAFAVGPIGDAASRELARREAARAPSSKLYTHFSSPVLAFSAIDIAPRSRRCIDGAVDFSGVPSSLYSGRAPRLSVLKCQATSSLLKLEALI